MYAFLYRCIYVYIYIHILHKYIIIQTHTYVCIHTRITHTTKEDSFKCCCHHNGFCFPPPIATNWQNMVLRTIYQIHAAAQTYRAPGEKRHVYLWYHYWSYISYFPTLSMEYFMIPVLCWMPLDQQKNK